MATVDVRGLAVTYTGVGPAGGREVEAIAAVDLHLDSGEPIAVIGPSGCGKSTLLLALAGLVTPTRGELAVDGGPVLGPRLRTALMLQDFGLLPWKTVARNAALGLEVRRVPKRERVERTAAALERVGLSEFADAYPGELSGGMRQRVALARALALDADVLLMDEPLSALDALTRENMQGLLLELWRQRCHTQVLVTHAIEEAVFLGRRIVVMTPRPGRIAKIVDNPRMGEPDYRSQPEFWQRCDELRAMLAAEGALRAPAVHEEGPRC